jgi:KDO2-lipid IV(A) lauroyltransferase
MLDRVEYYSLIALMKLIMLLPKAIRRAILKFLAYMVYLLYSKNKKIIRANLIYVYGDKIDEKEIKSIQKSCYKKFMLVILSIIENSHLSKQDINSMVQFENKEYIDQLISTNKPFIYVTAHMGNLDILGVIIGHFFGKTTHIQQQLKNPLLTEFIKTKRENYGIKVVDKKGAIKHLFSALKNKEIVSLVVDQNVNPKHASLVEFLGHKTYQTNAPATLARRFDVPLLPVFIVGDDDKYRVIFEKPIYMTKSSSAKEDIEQNTQLVADIMSKMILKYPHEWFWCHKRFKNSNPNIYG